jgi:hypothetical protein
MIPIPGETILYGSEDANFLVTSHRIRANYKSWGQANSISIMLEELCSSSVKYSSQPLLFVLAFFVFVGGGLTTLFVHPSIGNVGNIIRFVPICGGLAIAIGLAFLYFLTRRLTLVFASAGASIVLDAMSLGLTITKELIDTIEIAKNYRYAQSVTVNTEYQPDE